MRIVVVPSLASIHALGHVRPRYIIVAAELDCDLSALEQVRGSYPDAITVITADSADPSLHAGPLAAHAFIRQPASARQVLGVLAALDEGQGQAAFSRFGGVPGALPLPRRPVEAVAGKTSWPFIRDFAAAFSLSVRETEVLAAAAQGKCTKEIADALKISRKTVEYYWARLYEKLGCHSQLEALAVLINTISHPSVARELPGLSAPPRSPITTPSPRGGDGRRESGDGETEQSR